MTRRLGFALAFGCAACAPAESRQATQQRQPAQQALDSLATFRVPMTPAFYQELRGFVFSAARGPVAMAPRALSTLGPGVTRALDTAVAGATLAIAANGSHSGRMLRAGETIDRFELRTIAGTLAWTHDARGHHFYQIGPDARLVVGLSASTAHPGKPGTVGTVTLYDQRGAATGRFSCTQLGATEIAPDGAGVLVECHDSALVFIDRTGRQLAALSGAFRSFRASNGGRTIAAVRLNQPRSVVLGGAGRDPAAIELPAPVRLLALTADGALVAAAAGGAVYGLTRDGTQPSWTAPLIGPATRITGLAVGADGLVAVAGRTDSIAAVLALVRDGRLLRSVSFELGGRNAWVPSLALDPTGRTVLVWDTTTLWNLDVNRWLGR